MRGFSGSLGMMAFAGLVLLGTTVLADDKEKKEGKIAPDKLPKAVMDSIKGRFPGGEITGAEREIEDGKVMFDIELKHKGRKYEMDIQEDGTIVEIEKEVFAKDVPAAVTKALQKKYPKAAIKEVMEVNIVKGKEEKPAHYEATLEGADKKKFEVIVSLDGKSVKTEAEAAKEKAKK